MQARQDLGDSGGIAVEGPSSDVVIKQAGSERGGVQADQVRRESGTGKGGQRARFRRGFIGK